MDKANKKSLIFSLGVFLILLAALPIIVYQVQKPQEIRTRAQQTGQERQDNAALIASFNPKLSGLSHQYGKSQIAAEKAQIFREIKEVVTGRRDSILTLIKVDPAKANEVALSEGEVALLPRGIQILLEKKIEVEGTLEVLHEDDFETGKPKFYFFLNAKDGKRYSLYLPPVSKAPVSGANVRIKGVALEENIAAAPEDDGGITVLSEAAAQAPVTKNTAVILVNFQDYTSQPWTTATVNNVIFNQTSAYYGENSFGKLAITGDVYGYYTLPINRSCDRFSISNEAVKISDPDINFSDYQTIVIAGSFPCASAANVGNITIVTQDGNVSVGRAWVSNMTSFALGHELGHTYGVWHANFYNCGTSAFAPSGCTSQEYDDLFDIMDRRTAHMNSFHKERIGFFDASNVLTVNSSGSYTIEPMETATAGIQVLKLSIDSSRFLYIEYRQPLGVDSFLSSSILDGAMIHVARWFFGAGDTQLLDMTPTSPRSHSDVTLEVGRSFTYDGVATITTASQTPSGLTMDITILPPVVDVKVDSSGGPLSLTAPANYSISWNSTGSGVSCTKSGAWSGSAGASGRQSFNDVLTLGTYTYTVTCSNSAGSGSDSVTVNISDPTELPIVDLKVNGLDGPLTLSEPAFASVNWNAQYATSGCTNSGDWTGSAYSNYYASFYPLTVGTYTYTVTCSNQLGTASDSATVTVVPPDTIPPTVSITSPQDGAVVSGIINIAASATDNVGVSYVYFYVDGSFVGWDSLEPYSISWDTTTVADGSHVITAIAYDADGNNTTSAPVTVIVSSPSPTPTFTPTPTPPPSDTTPPIVSITSPLNGSTVSRNSTVTITASASDNIGVTKVEFLVNGSIKCTDAISIYSCSWKVPGARNRTYTLIAKAYDAAGNTATHNINVTSK